MESNICVVVLLAFILYRASNVEWYSIWQRPGALEAAPAAQHWYKSDEVNEEK